MTGAAAVLAAGLLAGSAAAQGGTGRNALHGASDTLASTQVHERSAGTLLARNDTAPKLPEDVRKFIARRGQCDHFRNEPAEDEQRQAEVAQAADKYCTGTDKELAHLKHAHATDKAVQDALSAYDPNIE